MDNFVTRRTRRAQLATVSRTSPQTTPHHSATSRQLAHAIKASQSLAPSQSASSQDELTLATAIASPPVHKFPADARYNSGLNFPIDWNHIFIKHKQIKGHTIGYRVKGKQQLRGGARVSPIFDYGADLMQVKDGKNVRVWLCRDCHLKRSTDCAKNLSANHHIVTHLLKVHRISVKIGFLPDLDAACPGNPWKATIQAAGSYRTMLHTLWQEAEMQQAFIDWVIIQDQSFLYAASPQTRVMLSWNRIDLLAALPSSDTTISKYIKKTYGDRIEEITALMAMAPSKISLGTDIWTSSNHLSFMGVTAHFRGKIYSSYHI